MVAPRTRYELRVETRLSPAALATFCVPVRPTDVPRNTVYRFRIPGDLDPYEVLHRLAEHDVQVLELRRCHEPSRRPRRTPPVPPTAGAPQDDGPSPTTATGVVIPFPARTGHRPPDAPVPDACA
jgi:hypothetical protein